MLKLIKWLEGIQRLAFAVLLALIVAEICARNRQPQTCGPWSYVVNTG